MSISDRTRTAWMAAALLRRCLPCPPHRSCRVFLSPSRRMATARDVPQCDAGTGRYPSYQGRLQGATADVKPRMAEAKQVVLMILGADAYGYKALSAIGDAQITRPAPIFPKPPCNPRGDDKDVLSGMIFLDLNGLRWRNVGRTNAIGCRK